MNKKEEQLINRLNRHIKKVKEEKETNGNKIKINRLYLPWLYLPSYTHQIKPDTDVVTVSNNDQWDSDLTNTNDNISDGVLYNYVNYNGYDAPPEMMKIMIYGDSSDTIFKETSNFEVENDVITVRYYDNLAIEYYKKIINKNNISLNRYVRKLHGDNTYSSHNVLGPIIIKTNNEKIQLNKNYYMESFHFNNENVTLTLKFKPITIQEIYS